LAGADYNGKCESPISFIAGSAPSPIQTSFASPLHSRSTPPKMLGPLETPSSSSQTPSQSVITPSSSNATPSKHDMSRRLSLQSRRGLLTELKLSSILCESENVGDDALQQNSASGPSAELPLATLVGASASTSRGVSVSLPCTNGAQPAGTASSSRANRPKRKKDPTKYLSGGRFCASPENKQPAVQLMLNSNTSVSSKANTPALHVPRLSIQRPLPGSFPNRRTVFFFDWDDTLCPTTWIRSILKAHIADILEFASPSGPCPEADWRDAIPGWFSQPLPDEPVLHEWMADLQRAAIDVINVAQAFGVVCIVTNAVPGWVEKTIKKWLPQLTQYIRGHGARPPIKVIYGQQVYKQPTGTATSLPWVNELGPYMWWKKSAMTMALDEIEELYRLEDTQRSPNAELQGGCGRSSEVLPDVSWCANGDGKRISSVISIGDNEAEMQAAEISAHGHEWRRIALHESDNSPSWSCADEGRPLSGTDIGTVGDAIGRRENLSCTDLNNGNLASSQRIPHRLAAASLEIPGSSHWPFVKLVKFRECPHVKELLSQLEDAVDVLPKLAALRDHQRIDIGHQRRHRDPRHRDPCIIQKEDPLKSPEQHHGPESASRLLNCADIDLRAERALRMQMI